MKKFTKVCLIICAVLVGLGMVGCIAGVTLGFRYQNIKGFLSQGNLHGWFNVFDWDWDDYDMENMLDNRENWKTDEYTFEAANIENIDIIYKFGDIIIEQAEGAAADKIKVTLDYRENWSNNTRKLTCSEDNGTLKIRDDISNKKWLSWKNHSNSSYVTVYLPQGLVLDTFQLESQAAQVDIDTNIDSRKIELNVDAGALESADVALQAKEQINLTIGAGSMDLYGLSTPNLDLHCGVGEMILSNADVQNALVDCGVGSVEMELQGRESDYNYELSSGIGEISIGSASYGGLGRSKMITNNDKDQLIKISSGVGSVEVSFREE